MLRRARNWWHRQNFRHSKPQLISVKSSLIYGLVLITQIRLTVNLTGQKTGHMLRFFGVYRNRQINRNLDCIVVFTCGVNIVLTVAGLFGARLT